MAKHSGRREQIEWWHVIRLRAKGQIIGMVQATNEEAAQEAAIATYRIKPVDRIIVLRAT